MMIRKKTQGFPILGLSGRPGVRQVDLFTAGRMDLFTQEDEDYVDDINIMVENPEDMLVIDKIFEQFESFSGAILNRYEKTKVMGLGRFEGRREWPLDWIKVEKSLWYQAFSDLFCNTGSELG